jgi:putative intracellular protease/amidase
MKVLVVVAQRFNGHELWTSLGVMQQRGHSFEVISTQRDIEDEVTGQPVKINRTIDDVKSLQGFEALMFVSGNMSDTESYWSDPRTLAYVDEARSKDLPIAAICCSVPTIRKAAKGKRVSFFPLIRSRELLENEGAILSTLTYSVDQKLVTAEHQMATQMWAEAFCDVLEGKEHTITLQDSGYVPRGRERKPIPELEYIKAVERRTGKKAVDD